MKYSFYKIIHVGKCAVIDRAVDAYVEIDLILVNGLNKIVGRNYGETEVIVKEGEKACKKEG